MASHFVFFYFMKRMPGEIREAVPLHVEYWKSRGLDGYAGGPFADRSGGMIRFESSGIDDATALVEGDPFVTRDLIENRWVKEWLPE